MTYGRLRFILSVIRRKLFSSCFPGSSRSSRQLAHTVPLSCTVPCSLSHTDCTAMTMTARFSIRAINAFTQQSNTFAITCQMAVNRGIKFLSPRSPTPSWGFPHHENSSWVVATWGGPVDGPRDGVTLRKGGLGGKL
jgi:hypothetical protein